MLPRLVLALLLVACGASAHADVLLSDRMQGLAIGRQVEVLDDPSGRLTRHDVESPVWQDRFVPGTADNLNLGYRETTLWIRLRLVRGASLGPWVLEVGNPLLDRVELHTQNRSSPWLGGDHTLLGERPLQDRHFLFPLNASAEGENVYLLRVTHRGAFSVPLALWDQDSLDAATRDASFALGAYYGLLGVMVLYNLFLFLVVRDRAYAAYGVYVATLGLVIALNNGYGGLYLWPDSPDLADWAQVAAAPLACATAAWFVRLYLLTPVHAPRTDRVLAAITWAGVLMLPFVTFLPRAWVFWTDHLLALVTIPAAYGAGILAWRRGYRPALYFLIAFLAVCVGAAFMVARNLGAPANFLTDYGIQIGSALEVVLLSMGLADRISTLRREKDAAQAEALGHQQRLVEALRESERELERRVAGRTEELERLNRSLQSEIAERERTAALLQASEERMRYQAQHDPLTGLPNRWLLRDRLAQAAARAKRDRAAFAVLLVDLDNFKAVNDTLGHDVGDLLLVEVAQRLSDCIRERDTIARIGGDEFVLVLEGLAAPEDSALVARKIVDLLAAAFPIAGELLRTSPSIGISLYPEDGQDPDFLLKFADIAMYRAKAAGRNCYRFYRDPEELHAYDKQAR